MNHGDDTLNYNKYFLPCFTIWYSLYEYFYEGYHFRKLFMKKKKKNFFDNFFQFIQQLFQFFIKGFLELIINVCPTRLFFKKKGKVQSAPLKFGG